MGNAAFTAGSGTAPLDQRFALDVQSVDALRRTARSAPDEAIKQVARQFEAIFMGMVLKSMREATPESGLLGGQSTKMYQSLLDQQLAQHLSGRGLKVADALLAQLRRSLPPSAATADAPDPQLAVPGRHEAAPRAAATIGSDPSQSASAALAPSSNRATAAAIRTARAAAMPLDALPAERAAAAPVRSAAEAPASGIQARVQQFVDRLGAAARSAAEATGVPHKLILAQAALESGWGRREIRGDDGARSFNLFGIKADASWRGAVTQATTTEVIDGVSRRVRAAFRAYSSYEEAFADYANFIAGNPRYRAVRAQTDPARAAQALQRAGYATDPAYAGKLIRVMKRLFE